MFASALMIHMAYLATAKLRMPVTSSGYGTRSACGAGAKLTVVIVSPAGDRAVAQQGAGVGMAGGDAANIAQARHPHRAVCVVGGAISQVAVSAAAPAVGFPFLGACTADVLSGGHLYRSLEYVDDERECGQGG